MDLDLTSPRDLSLAQSVPYPAFALPNSDQLLDFNGDGELEYVSTEQLITPTTHGPLISPKYNFRGEHLRSTPPVAIADFDNDGPTNSLEILHGPNVISPDQAPADFLTISLSPDGRFLHHLSRKSASAPALYYDLEVSNDLINWSRTPAPSTTQPAAGLWDTVSIEIPSKTRKKFHRISATHDPRR